ncbi:MAG: phosphonate C-P lyase system protein PhnH [Pseudomonadota bacterium]
MTPADLAAIGPGFSDLAYGSQAVFRAALDALSYPGRPVAVPHDAQVPAQGNPAAAALLLALLDADSRLWLSPALAGGSAAAWLRFHTGCTLVETPGEAQFAWVAQGDALPPLAGLAQGSDACPDQSATCVVDVPGLGVAPAGSGPGEGGWTLRGPGIDGMACLRVGGPLQQTDSGFAAQWAGNHASFPRGVDLFLAAPAHIVGLPRTTAIEQEH